MNCAHCGNLFPPSRSLRVVPNVRPPSVECAQCHCYNPIPFYKPAVEPPTPHIPRLSIAAAMLAGDDSVATVVLTQGEIQDVMRSLNRSKNVGVGVAKLLDALTALYTSKHAVIVFKGSWDDT